MKDLEKYIQKDLYNIFGDTNISTLSDYQKREMIFDYLSSILQYDWYIYIKLYGDAIHNKVSDPRNRNFSKEFEDVVIHHHGVCIAIASYYDTLLKKVGICDYVIGTNDESPVHHVLNAVYNAETDSFSFDDVTSTITRIRPKEYCFDYDIEDANKIRQGIRPLFKLRDDKWITLPTLDKTARIQHVKFDEFKDKIISTRKINDYQRKRKNTI